MVSFLEIFPANLSLDEKGRGMQDWWREAEDGYLSYGMLQEGQVPGRAEKTRRGRELCSGIVGS